MERKGKEFCGNGKKAVSFWLLAVGFSIDEIISTH
jgi:hypothetical protein